LDEFFPVEIGDGPSQFHSIPFNGSGDIRLGFKAQAFALHPHNQETVKKGEFVRGYLL